MINERSKNLVLFTLVFLAVLGYVAAYFSGYRAAVADYQSRAVEIQQSMAELGQVIQRQEAKQAELTRQKVIAERERIDAIKTTDHKTAEVRRLESKLAAIARQHRAGNQDNGSLQGAVTHRYHIFDAAVIERVFDDASGNNLPETEPAGAVQTRLPEITLRAGNYRPSCGRWRRLVCFDKNSCWLVPGMQNQPQFTLAAM